MLAFFDLNESVAFHAALSGGSVGLQWTMTAFPKHLHYILRKEVSFVPYSPNRVPEQLYAKGK